MNKIKKVIYSSLIIGGCVVVCLGCRKETIEYSAHLPSIIGKVLAIENEEIDILVTQGTNEIGKGESVSVKIEEPYILESRVKELDLTEGSIVRVLYTEIDEVAGEKEITIIVPENIVLW